MIIQVAGAVGAPWTIALLVAASVIGAYLLKRESRRAWRDFRAALSAGRFPGDEVTQGALVIVGGTLLLAPGFVTDVVGFLCLLPPSRAVVSRLVRRRVVPGAIIGGAATSRGTGRRPQGDPGGPSEGGVYEVEVIDIQREPPPERDER